MAASNTILTVGMDLTQSVPYFTFTDSTNYALAGVTEALGTLKITVNGSVIYDNLEDYVAPDINTTNGTTRADTIPNTNAIPLPMLNGEVVTGSYKFEYYVEYDASGINDTEAEITMDVQYDKVTGSLTSEVNLLPTNPTMTTTDTTDYTVAAIEPTIVRALSLSPPSIAGLPLSTSTTTAASLVLTTFSTGVWYSELNTTATYDFSTKVLTTATNNYNTFTLNIIDNINKILEIPVEGSTQLCEIFCCLSEWEEKLNDARTTPTEYLKLRSKSGEISYYLSLTQQAYACSVTTDINHYVNRIKDLTGCNGQCGCDNDTPTLISGVATSNAALGNKIKFTTTGTTTNYTNLNFTGKSFNDTQQDFIVTVDGMDDEGTFSESTYTYQFQNSIPVGVDVKFIFLR